MLFLFPPALASAGVEETTGNIAVVNVQTLGAVGDGQTDDTAVFERALELGRNLHRPVYAPRAQYRVTRPLRLENQLLIGDFAGGWPADSLPLPTLVIAQVDGPGLEMGNFASLHGLGLLYPEGTPFPEKNGPPAIALAGQGPSITSVRIQYPYAGIMTAPGGHPGRARLADIFIVSPQHEGIYLTKSYDVSQLRNIEVWCNGAPAIRLTRCQNFSLSTTWFTRAFDVDYYFVEAQQCESFTVMGCQFTPHSPGLLLGEGVKRAVVMGNILEAPREAIVDRMAPDAKRLLEPNLIQQKRGSDQHEPPGKC